MSNPKPCFEYHELSDEMPAPGYYDATISSARFRRSANGNRMLQVIHDLERVPRVYQRLADYFVLEGASPRGILMAKRRLVQMYRACGFDPKDGDEISPNNLMDARLQVRVEHDEWDNQPRLRIVGYRPSEPTPSDDPVPF